MRALGAVALALALVSGTGAGGDLNALHQKAASLRANLQQLERRIQAAEAREPPAVSDTCASPPLTTAADAVVRLAGGVKLRRLGFGGALWGAHINATHAFATAMATGGYGWIDAAPSFGNAAALHAALPVAAANARWLVARLPAASAEATAAPLEERLAELTQATGGRTRIKVLLLDGLHPSRAARLALWREALRLRDTGHVQAVGVSNWAPRHLDELVAAELELPALVQAEFHVFLQSRGVVEWCQARGVAVAAYGTLGGRSRPPPANVGQTDDASHAKVRYLHPEMLSIVHNPTLRAIGRQHGKTAAQVAIRWTLQRGVLAMPCSSSEDHQLENADVFEGFELSGSDMIAIASLDVPELSPIGLYGFGDPNDAVETDAVDAKAEKKDGMAAEMSEDERRAAVMDLLGSQDLGALGLRAVAAELQELGFEWEQVKDLLSRLHGTAPSLAEGSGLGAGGALHPFLINGMHNVSWMALAAPLYSPQMGVENMGPLLYALLRFHKPTRVLEVGAGFSTLFILQALADNANELQLYERLAIEQHHDTQQTGGDQRSRHACALADGTAWCADDWLAAAAEEHTGEPAGGVLHSVDKLKGASRIRQIARAMGTGAHLKLHVADIFDGSAFDLSMGGVGPLDVVWLDFGSGEMLPEIAGRLWRRIKPGGLLLVHSTMTNAYGRLWLRSLREGSGLGTSSNFGLKGDFELLSLVEPTKRLQNSVSVLRKLGAGTAAEPPIYTWAA